MQDLGDTILFSVFLSIFLKVFHWKKSCDIFCTLGVELELFE